MEQIVKIKPIEIPTSRIDVKSTKRTTSYILPGASYTLAPALDGFGRVVTGTNEEEYKKIMSLEDSDPIPYKEFYKKLSVKIGMDGKDLNLEIPKHQLIYKFLLTLPQVAKNKNEVNPSIHAFYIQDADREAVEKLSGIKLRKKAYSLFDKMSPEDVRDFLILYGKNSDRISDDVAQAKLGELLEDKPERFIKLFEDNNKEMKINLGKLFNKGIVRKEGKAYFYGDQGEAIFLGSTEELAIEKLKDPENQELYISLLSQLK